MAFIGKSSNDNNKSGKTNYSSGIVAGIVALAVSEIQGVAILSKNNKVLPEKHRTKKINEGIKLTYKNNGIYVDVSIKVYYGYKVPDIAFKIQENIKQSVESMSEFKIKKVDVHVEDVIFQDELPVIAD